MKKNFRKGLKIFLWIVGVIIGIFLLLALSLQIPYVQNLAKEKAVSYLEGKIHTKVAIDRIEIGLPKKVILEGVYFEDQQKDTLLAGKKIAIDMNLFQQLAAGNRYRSNHVARLFYFHNLDLRKTHK